MTEQSEKLQYVTAFHKDWDINAAKDYIDALIDLGLMYHFEDPAAEALERHGLSENALYNIGHNVGQIMALDWEGGSDFGDAFDYAMQAGA